MDNKPYRTVTVKPELVEQVIDAAFNVMEERNCDLRDVTKLEMRKAAHISRKTFLNNFQDKSGVSKAINHYAQRKLERIFVFTSSSDAQLSFFLCMKYLTELKDLRREVDYCILTNDREFWISILQPLKPVLWKAWFCRYDSDYNLGFNLLSGVIAEIIIEWRHEQYSEDFQQEAATMLYECAVEVGKLCFRMRDVMLQSPLFR